MSSSNVKMEGLNELVKTLANTERDMSKAKKRANIRGAEVVADELRKQAPRGKNDTYKYSKDGHMADNVVTSSNKKNKNTGESYTEVGFPKGVAWRSHFPLGTIKQAPNPYFDRTTKNSASKVNSAMASEIKKVLS